MSDETSRPSHAVAKMAAVVASTPLTPAAEITAVMFSALRESDMRAWNGKKDVVIARIR